MFKRTTLAGVIVLIGVIILGWCSIKDNHKNASDEQYPTKPITILVPYSAGGTSDSLARMMEKKAMQYLGQPLLVMSKPGGSGAIVWNELVSSEPDGYTIAMASPGVILQPLYGQAKFNYSTALDPLAKITDTPVFMAVLNNSNWGNLNDFIAYAKAHPGEVKYGQPGLGTSVHMLAEMFARSAGIQMEQVPFQGDSEILAALLGNHIQVAFLCQGNLKEYVKSGQVKILAVGKSQRLKDEDFKNIATFKEQGLDVQLENGQWIVAPKELSPKLKSKLVIGIKEIINDAEFQKNMHAIGLEIEYLGPEECRKEWVLQREHFRKIVHESGIAERIAAQIK